MIRPFVRASLLVAAALALSSCSSDNENQIACPSVEVLQDLGELVRFRPGPGRDPTDVLVEAWIDGVGGECSQDGSDLRAELTVRIGTRRGPATKTDKAALDYFVAITDLQRNVLQRQSFKAAATFLNRKTIVFQDVLDLRIPMARGAKTDSYAIYVGLQLSEKELAYNRSKRK